MRLFHSLIIACLALAPLQAVAQSGSTGGSGTGSAGATTGTAGNTTGTVGIGNAASPGGMNSPRGTNSLGTAQSSGRGVTTGAASGSTAVDEKTRAEDARLNKKLKSICRGC